MGLFSGIVKAVAAPVGAFLGGPVGGAIGASLAGSLGASEQNAANFKLTKNQMQFQRDMSNTAHQREVLDLQAAGLNPMLTGKYQGASTPPGALTPAVNTAAAGDVAASNQASRSLVEAQIRASESQVLLNSANAAKVAAETDAVRRENEIGGYTADYEKDARMSKLRTEIVQGDLSRAQASQALTTLDRMNHFTMKTYGMNFDEYLSSLDMHQRQEVLRKVRLENDLSGYELPKAKAFAGFYNSEVGKLSPYLSTAEGLARGAGSIGLRVPRR